MNFGDQLLNHINKTIKESDGSNPSVDGGVCSSSFAMMWIVVLLIFIFPCDHPN